MKNKTIKTKEKKNSFYTIVILLSFFIIISTISIIGLIIKNNKIINLKNEISNIKKQESNNLKNNSEYGEFDPMIRAFAQEMYYQVYNYYSKDYFVTDEIKEINDNRYYKIYRINEIKMLLSDKKFEEFIKEKKIIKQDEDYYIPVKSMQENELYILERSGEMEIKEISRNKIELAVQEVYYKNTYSDFDINDLIYKVNKFVLVKENGIWRVDEYTDPNKI